MPADMLSSHSAVIVSAESLTYQDLHFWYRLEGNTCLDK